MDNASLISYLGNSTSIGLYFGSFDPVHAGHLDVVDVILRNHCQKLICCAVLNNNGKPNLSPYESRHHMLEISMPPSVLIVHDIPIYDLIELLREFRPGATLSSIIGSDTYNVAIKRPNSYCNRIPVDRFLVVSRIEHPIDHWVPHPRFELVDPVSLSLGAKLSSTMIRSLISKGEDIPEDYLPEDVRDYVRERVLYR